MAAPALPNGLNANLLRAFTRAGGACRLSSC